MSNLKIIGSTFCFFRRFSQKFKIRDFIANKRCNVSISIVFSSKFREPPYTKVTAIITNKRSQYRREIDKCYGSKFRFFANETLRFWRDPVAFFAKCTRIEVSTFFIYYFGIIPRSKLPVRGKFIHLLFPFAVPTSSPIRKQQKPSRSIKKHQREAEW